MTYEHLRGAYCPLLIDSGGSATGGKGGRIGDDGQNAVLPWFFQLCELCRYK